MLENYLHKFEKLRTDRGRNRYPTATRHRAPHKSFLLLSIMDMIAQGQINDNFIKPSFELVDTWSRYWNAVMPIGHRSTMAHPFSRLQSDGFWLRVPNSGYDAKTDYNISSMSKLRKVYAGARLDDALFAYMVDPVTREQLRVVLVQTYFIKAIHPLLFEQGKVNQGAYKYAKDIIAGVQERAENYTAAKPEQLKIRGQGFRKAIVQLYDHRCALCGIRMRTPEGHTVVEAAHIVPWNKSHDDFPTNGLCLWNQCETQRYRQRH